MRIIPSKLRGTRSGIALLALLVALVSATFPAFAQTPATDAAAKALTWVKAQQQPDGSFPGFGVGSTVDTVLAILAAGQDPATYTQGGNTPMSFLESKAADLAKTPGGAGKLLIAVSTAGQDPRSFGGVNLLDAIGAGDPTNGHYGEDVIGHAFAMLGLNAAAQPIPAKAVDYLKSAQGADGGWSFSGDTTEGAADTNTTSVAVQALAAAGESSDSPAMQKARTYLMSQPNTDGGFPYQKGGEFGSDSDVNSTAYVVQALIHLNESPETANGFILSMQKANGAFQWKASETDDNAGATYQAVPAILGVSLVEPRGVSVISAPAGDPAPVPGTNAAPGMPTTGGGPLPVGAWAVVTLAALLLIAGTAARRKSRSA